MLSTLLATKLHRPHPTSNLVARPRLTQRLEEGLRDDHRLFLVVAPAGYGKTTLVTEWLDKTDVPSAWLSLDEADNDPLRFFTYVVAALQKTLGPKLTQPVPEVFPMTPQSPEAFVHLLINDLATVGRPVILVLDDYHVITAAPVQEAMAFLLRRAPLNVHLIVLTRVDPPFPLPRLRVRGRMTEIRDRDLRFTPEEMVAFLNSLHHLNLPADQVTALEARTEGWAAGVQLAALSLQGSSPERTAEFIDAFSGSHHYIVDYLFDEVLSRQPDAVRQFLLQTSILDRMCAPLCDSVVVPDPDSQSMLQHLERTNLFLVPLDDARHWYRYHHLFVDVLRGMLRAASQPEQVAALHGRASDWYRQNVLVAEAVHHALLAGHHERAAETVEENAWSMVRRAELTILKQWVEALPPDSLSARPWLRIYYAWALFFSESEAAEAQLQAVEQQMQAEGTTPLPVEMQGHIAAIRAWIGNMRGEQGRAAVLARQALEFCPHMDAAVRSGLAAILGDGCLVQNDLPAAARAYVEARDLARSGGNVMLEVISHAALGVLAVCMGRLSEAEAIYQEALQTATRNKSPAAGQAYTDLARVYREWNDLASVRFYAEKLIESATTWGVADAVACGHLYLAMVLQAEGDISGANRAITEAGRVMRRHSLELASRPWLGATRARLWLEQGRLDDARHWAETRGLGIEDAFDLWHEIEYSTLVRILLAEGRVEEATRLLSRLQDAVEATGRQGDLIGVLALRAMALDTQAETGAALAVLEQAVRLARQEGHVRTFLEAGRRIEPLLKIGVTQWREHDLVAYARKLLGAFAAEGGQPAAPQAPEPAILSERELEVLRLMAAGCSNQEIAANLVIALGTAKRHTANIFNKLDVRNRTEAVARARKLGLL